ncbi:MAG: ABC transporter ATP-binding protein [Leptothrix sp. (in: b-proteobacteria)]
MSSLPNPDQSGGVALELRDLHKSFGRSDIIRGVNLQVRRGERVAIIGPNGAGKSTLFHLISGGLAPSRGSIWLAGARIDGLTPYQIQRRGLARSFQVSQLFARLSVEDNLRCALLGALGHRGVWWRRLGALQDVRMEVQARLEPLLAELQLVAQRRTPVQQLTYAEQRALDLGLALAGNAELLLLDEPTAGMSRSETGHFVELIRRVSAGRTLLMVEHDMGVVFDLADRIAVLVQGELIAFDTPAAVRADPRVQQAYLGDFESEATAWAAC